MSFIMDYDIVTRVDAKELAAAVRERINEAGWQPFGAPYVTLSGWHCQAIVRYAGAREDGRVHFERGECP